VLLIIEIIVCLFKEFFTFIYKDLIALADIRLSLLFGFEGYRIDFLLELL
jgi:hypothetical protein